MPLEYQAPAPLQQSIRLSLGDLVNAIRQKQGMEPVAQGLEQIGQTISSLIKELNKARSNRFDELFVIDPDTGELIGWIGSRAGYKGGYLEFLYVGGTSPDDAPFFSDGSKVVIGRNGQVWIQNTLGEDKGFLGVEEENPKAIAGAANNGSGLIRLTISAHGWESGDTIIVAGVGGVTGSAGTWPITVVDSSHVDLLDSAWSGAYTSGGTATRYFAGLHTENVALGGPGFEDSLARVYADGSIRVGPKDGPRLRVLPDGSLIIGDPAIGPTFTVNPDGSLLIGEATGPRAEVSADGDVSLTDASIELNGASTSKVTMQASPTAQIVVSGPSSQMVLLNGQGQCGPLPAGFPTFAWGKTGFVQTGSGGSPVGSFNATNGFDTTLGYRVNGSLVIDSTGTVVPLANYYTKTQVDAFVANLQSQINALNTSLANKTDYSHIHTGVAQNVVTPAAGATHGHNVFIGSAIDPP